MDQKILDALKKINEKLGGTNDPNEKWGTLLQEIAENIDGGGGGGSSLPSVTSADNGDVLTVVEGEWAKAEPSGASDVMVVSFEEPENGPITCNKTYSEIIEALNAGKAVVGVIYDSGAFSCSLNIALTYLDDGEDSPTLLFRPNTYITDAVFGDGYPQNIENESTEAITYESDGTIGTVTVPFAFLGERTGSVTVKVSIENLGNGWHFTSPADAQAYHSALRDANTRNIVIDAMSDDLFGSGTHKIAYLCTVEGPACYYSTIPEIFDAIGGRNYVQSYVFYIEPEPGQSGVYSITCRVREYPSGLE